jgi:hypothetical protein
MANFKLNKQIARQCSAFLHGFHKVIDVDWLRMFGQAELQMLVSGADESVDVDDFWTHVVFAGGYSRDDVYMTNLRAVLSEFSASDWADFLAFSTGYATVPVLVVASAACSASASASASAAACDARNLSCPRCGAASAGRRCWGLHTSDSASRFSRSLTPLDCRWRAPASTF